MRKRLIVLIVILSMSVSALPSRIFAADNGVMMQNVFRDTLYGGAIGAVIGVGFMLLTKEPKDHWNYIAYGAGGGIIAGAAISIASSTKAVAEIEGGRITFNVPNIKTNIIQDKRDEKTEVVRHFSLLRYNF